jgi:predicted Zn-dependent peptidase
MGEIMYKKIILDNGLKLLVAPMKTTRIISVNVFVKIGSRYETIDNNGITHFIEHMLFRGTVRRPDMLSISKEIDAIGGDINAATAKEYSHFYVDVLDKHFEKALDVLSDILHNSRFDKSDIEIEKKTILEENRMYKDLPSRYVRELYDKLLYGRQPLGFSILGEEKILRRVSRKDILNYWGKNFVSTNTIISIAGNVNVEKVQALTNKYFGKTRRRKSTKFDPIKKEIQKKQAVSIHYKKIEQTHLCIGTRSHGRIHPDFGILKVMNIILGATMSSRLFTILRAQKGLVYSVSSFNAFFADTGSLVVNAGVGPKNVIETLEIILNEFNRLKNEDVKEGELEGAKNYLIGSLYMGLDSSSDVANYVGIQELYFKKIMLPRKLLEKFLKVTASDIRRVANDIFRKNNLNLALVGPLKEKGKFEKILEGKSF